MRTFMLLMGLALSLVPVPALAQAGAGGSQNWIDFGVRGTSLNGDGARFERYRDLGDGLFLEGFRLNRERGDWFLQASGEHVGRDDQRFTARVTRPGRLKAWGRWDQIPMLMSRSTQTIFTGVGTGRLQIDDGVQGDFGDNIDLFLATAVPVDTRSRRHILEGGLQVIANQALTLDASVRHTDREGVIPFGGSFGHSSIAETLAPVNHQLTDVDASAEVALDPVLLRAGYTASIFNNDQMFLEFDNPFRLTDLAAASSRGRASLAPSSTYFAVNGLASVSLPARTTISAYGSIGSLKDAGDPIMPFTINSQVTAQPLVRDTVDGEARTTASTLTLTSRPTRAVGITARYRWYEYDNRTPQFALRQYEAYDGSPSTIDTQDCRDEDAVCTEPFGVKRQTFDVDLRLTPMTGAAVGIGYTRLDEGRSHRIYDTTAEDVVRVSFDSVGTQFVTLRTKFEHSRKRGDGFNIEPLEHAGEQPGMRHFDVASRDRDRVTVLATVVATDALLLNASVAAGKDDYLESEFGLRDNKHRVVTVGFDAMPSDLAVISGSYSFERYQALSRSRQATSSSEFDDPSRNWATDALDKVHSVILMADFTGIRDRVDLGFSYDFNRARAFYNYITGPVPDRTLPEEVELETTLPDPEQLPPTLSQLHRATTDIVFWATERLGFGVSHWFEDYEVEDFTLDAQSTPDLLRGNTLLLGYLYRPYRANTVWGRVFYRW